jgi:hypothetical protein
LEAGFGADSGNAACVFDGGDESAGRIEPRLLAISTMQVGLVTLISVRWSPITSRPTSSRPRLIRIGAECFGDFAVALKVLRDAGAAGGQVAARLAGLGDARQAKGHGWPAMSRMRLSPG